MKLFLYGTLADPAALGRCAGRPVRAEPLPALLAGYRRVLLRGARYPTLRRAPGSEVHGVILRVNADMLVRLINYESTRYRVVQVRLATPRGAVRARCFYGDAPTRVAWAPDEKLMTLRSRSF
ncbi:MAG TPA: gamma-glutamylcyclotransferase [Acidocella sp.]|nr:gamma-glutamylcyclotransferase [Acidocella sp.]